jgi:hypothetical protein
MTVTLSQTGSSVTGISVIQCSGCGAGQDNINGTANGNTAIVAITHLDGTPSVPVATFTITGTGMSTQWPGSGGVMVTGALTAGASASTPAPAPTPAAGKYDGIYDFSFTYPKQGGGLTTVVMGGGFFIVRSGRISSSDATVAGAVLDNFGNVRFTGPCWTSSGGVATWTGQLNVGSESFLLGGGGPYVCQNNINGGSWRAYNGSR